MNERDSIVLNELFNTALMAALPYPAHEKTKQNALHLEARLKRLHEMEQGAKEEKPKEEKKPKA